MSAIKDIQLKGNNLCNVECQDKNSVVHPETCVDQVLTTHTGSVTLSDWLTYSGTETPLDGFDSYNGLIPWLQHYYPINGYTLPTATYSNAESAHIGGVMVDHNYLTLSQSGVLSIKVASLHIPSEVETTSYTTEGKIALGNDTKLPSNFVKDTITDTSSNIYPLRLDANKHAGIAIPQSDFSAQVQSNWNQNNDSAVDYIKNKPTIPTVYNSTVTFKQGNITKGTVTLNQSSSATINLDAVEIATSSTLGGIKIGYTKEGNKKPVQLDINNMAYVDTEQHQIAGGFITNGLHSFFFRPSSISNGSSDLQANNYLPIIKSHSENQGKIGFVFEIFGREDSGTYYAKYYVNCMNGSPSIYANIVCLGFYTNSSLFLAPTDIQLVISNDKKDVTIYKKEYSASDGMYIVNILDENNGHYDSSTGTYSGYSTQTYYTTSSVQDAVTLQASDAITYTDWENITGKVAPVSMCTWSTQN